MTPYRIQFIFQAVPLSIPPGAHFFQRKYLALCCGYLVGTLAFVAPSTYAQSETVSADLPSSSIEEILIVDTRLINDSFSIGDNLTVDANALLNIQPVDAEQLFQRLPGFALSRPGGAGGVSELFLRGAESNFTAVYVDGIRLNNSSNSRGGSFDFSTLDLYGIDHIDVATGAMSAVYGSDAMAGVIRIQSAWAPPGSTNVFAEAGNADDWRAGIATSLATGQDSQWNLRASVADGGDDIEGSALKVENFGTRFTGQLSEKGTWELNIRNNKRTRSSFPEVSGGPKYSVLNDLENAQADELSIVAAGNWEFTPNWSSDIYLSSARISEDASTPAVAPGILDGQPAFTSITEYERRQALWVNRITINDDLHLVAGLDSVNEEGSDDGAIDFGIILPNSYTLSRDINSAFLELGKQWVYGITTTLAARWDDGDEERLSGKVGIQKQTSNLGSHVWVRAANGFKLPSFFALGNPLFGNPNLVPETVRNAEIGYTHVLSNGSEFIASLYKSEFDNLVDFDFDTFTNVNRGKFNVQGVEVKSLLVVNSSLKLMADVNWSNISSDAGPLRRRPERTAGVALDWSPQSQYHLNVSARYMGSRLITSIPTGDVKAPAYTLISATLGYDARPNQRLWLAVDNAFDEEYEDAPGFPAPSLSVRIGTKYSF